MTDTSGGSEEEEDEDFTSDFEHSFSNKTGDHLYLFIETLTGTSFEMKVSPFETIISIKAKLQQLEGIPATQQHLLYNNSELPNNYSLYECDVPDGATLKLVLSMRGGPINTRKIPIHDDSTRELQEVVERSKDELLEHIPEGGHVTVLVFRDGDQINLYHVLERPDGSYSPLSDSWSGSSIRNLFAEQDDPEVQERLNENANTMSKMQEIRNKIQDKQNKKTNSNRQGDKIKRPKSKGLKLDNKNKNLPPIKKLENADKELPSNDLEFRNLTSMSQIQRSSNHFQSSKLLNRREPLPRVRDRKKSTIDFFETPPSTATFNNSHGRLSNNNFNNNHAKYEHSNLPTRVKNNKKLISVDVNELKKTVDGHEGLSPRLVTNQNRLNRSLTSMSNSDKLTDSLNNDIFDRQRLFSPLSPTFLTSPINESKSGRKKSGNKNERLKEDDNRLKSQEPFTPSPSDNFRVPYLNINNDRNFLADSKVVKDLEDSLFSPEPRGLEKRLLHSRRGRLKSITSPVRRSVLASPKLNSPRTPKSSAGKLRPTYQTRPLSGPKRKKTPKKRCGQADCRKKLNLTNSFSCRCEKTFCPLHRHPESHSCTYDYKTEGRKLLEAANPLVTVPKLPKI